MLAVPFFLRLACRAVEYVHLTIHTGGCMERRTNIVLDEGLVEEAMRYAGVGTKRELVDLALREFVESRKRRDLRELRGRVRLRPGYDHKRLREGLREPVGEEEGRPAEEIGG